MCFSLRKTSLQNMNKILKVLPLCALMALLLRWEINLVFYTDETGDSTLARYSLFLSSLCSGIKNLASDIEEFLDISLKTINRFRSRALNHRLFKSLCEDLGNENAVILFHTEVR